MGYTTLYGWLDLDGPNDEPKFGDHYIEDESVDWKSNVKDYIRSTLNRQKHKYDLGRIEVFYCENVTEQARKDGKNYPNAKYDDFVASKSRLNQYKIVTPGLKKYKGDVYKINKNDLVKKVNSYINGTFALESYSSHQFQIEAKDKALAYFNNGGCDFLLDAVMRFGKCHTSYLITKELKAKRVLVITGRPKVKNGWANDLDHIYFGPSYQFIDSQTTNDVVFETNTTDTQIIFASFQGAKRNNIQSRLDKVVNQQIDLVIIDEFHAYYSESAKEFINSLKTKKRLWVSGTPFKAYEEGRFNGIEDTYRFTLIDALRAKKQGLPRFSDFPEPLILIAEFPDIIKNRLAGNEEMNMAKLLSNNGGIPNYALEAHALLDLLMNPKASAGASCFLAGAREGIKTKVPRTHNHIWFAVPKGKDDTKEISVASADTLLTVCKEHLVFNKYAGIKVGGDVGGDELTVQQWHNNHTLTSLFSAGALNTGTTLPKLDTLVYLKESESASDFWQTFGRIMNPNQNKQVVTAVLPGPEFYATMIAKMVEYSSSKSNYQEVFEEAISLMPSYLIGGIKPIPVDLHIAYKLLSTEGSVYKSFKDSATLGYQINSLIANNLTLLQDLPDMSSEKEPVYLNSQLQSGKNVQRITQNIGTSTNTNTQQNQIDKIKAKIREFNTTIPSIVALARARDHVIINSVSDLLAVDKDLLDTELFPNAKDWVEFLFNNGFLNKAIVEKKISMFNKFEIEPLCK